MKAIVALVIVISALMAGVMIYIRLAPVDAARWHLVPGAGPPPHGAVAAVNLPQQSPAQVLARLEAVAGTTPRTRRIAGSVEEGLITWETRSAFWGFPDYTTAMAEARGDGALLRLTARQRFGSDDYGVNAARLADWLRRIGG